MLDKNLDIKIKLINDLMNQKVYLISNEKKFIKVLTSYIDYSFILGIIQRYYKNAKFIKRDNLGYLIYTLEGPNKPGNVL